MDTDTNRFYVQLKVKGYAAYVIHGLQKQRMFGASREGIIEQMVHDWIDDRQKRCLSQLGLNVDDAVGKGYLSAEEAEKMRGEKSILVKEFIKKKKAKE